MPLVPALCLAVVLAAETRFDAEGFPLPREAIRRLGSARFLTCGWNGQCVGYTDGGRTLVTVSNAVIAWDAATGHARWRYNPPRTRITAAALSRDGKTVWVIAHRHPKESSAETASVLRLSARDGAVVGRVALDAASVMCLSPAGRVAVLRTSPNAPHVQLLDGATGTTLGRWPVADGESVVAARIAPDGKRVAVASNRNDSNESRIRIWEPATGRVHQEIQVGEAPTHAHFRLRFAPDGRRLYALLTPGQWQSNNIPDSSLRAWDLRTGARLFAFAVKLVCEDGSMAPPGGFAVSPDGKLAAVTGWQRPTEVYNLPDGTLRFRLPIYSAAPPAFDPTGKILNVGGVALTQWDATTGKRLAHSPPPGPSGRLAFSAGGQRLAIRPVNNSDQVEWNLRTGREAYRIHWTDTKRSGWVGRCGYFSGNDRPPIVRSVDGSVVAEFVFHRENPQHPDNGKIILRDGKTGRQRSVVPSVGNCTYGIVLSDDGRFLVNDAVVSVNVYDTTTGKVIHRIMLQRESNNSMTFSGYGRLHPSPDGRHLAILETNTTDPPASHWALGVYDLTTGKEVRRFRGTGTLNEITWSADGARLAAVGAWNGAQQHEGGVLFVGDLSTDHAPIRATRTSQYVASAALSPDGRTLAVSVDGAIQLWEVATGKIRHAFSGGQNAARSLAFAPDGRTLAALSADGPVLLWDVRGELTRAKALPDEAALNRAWDALAGDAERAYRAIRLLAHAPKQALPFLKRKLEAAPTPKPERIAALIQQLDSPAFAERERAEAELRRLIEWAAPALRKALTESGSAEVRQRAERVLKAPARMTPRRLRTTRAIEAVEWIGGPDAVELLGRITYGSAEARAALARLRR